MNTVKLNSKGPDVLFLQARLGLKPDGSFGPVTDAAVKEYQEKHGLTPDGVVGPKTWNTFTNTSLTEEDYIKAAEKLGCDVPAIKAIKTVESSGKAFIDGIRPAILFEGHVFWKELKNKGINPSIIKGYSDVLYPTWNKGKYKGGNAEYARLEKAWNLNSEAAMKSASMGMFQIMGNNFKLTGEDNVWNMWAKASLGEKNMLDQFCNFIKKTGIAEPLRNHNWKEVARRYNGAGYAANKYDVKLKEAYNRFKKING